jgi:cytochrome c-type biogenesis protein CcmH/NrfG
MPWNWQETGIGLISPTACFFFKQGRADESLKMLREAYQLQPDTTEVRFELARVLYHKKQLAEAAGILQGSLASNQCRVHSLMAKILALEGNSAEAEQEIHLLEHCLPTDSPSSSNAQMGKSATQ